MNLLIIWSTNAGFNSAGKEDGSGNSIGMPSWDSKIIPLPSGTDPSPVCPASAYEFNRSLSSNTHVTSPAFCAEIDIISKHSPLLVQEHFYHLDGHMIMLEMYVQLHTQQE